MGSQLHILEIYIEWSWLNITIFLQNLDFSPDKMKCFKRL